MLIISTLIKPLRMAYNNGYRTGITGSDARNPSKNRFTSFWWLQGQADGMRRRAAIWQASRFKRFTL